MPYTESFWHSPFIYAYISRRAHQKPKGKQPLQSPGIGGVVQDEEGEHTVCLPWTI